VIKSYTIDPQLVEELTPELALKLLNAVTTFGNSFCVDYANQHAVPHDQVTWEHFTGLCQGAIENFISLLPNIPACRVKVITFDQHPSCAVFIHPAPIAKGNTE
jgi:hypothetical protein